MSEFVQPDRDHPDRFEPVLPGRGASDYERYLRTDELLSLQKTPDEMVHRDELLFQVVHQTSELWLKLAVNEAHDASAVIDEGHLVAAGRLLRRAVLALDYVTSQLEMLGKISPWEYHQIRVVLGHGSGFDSPGFRGVARATQRLGAAFNRLIASRATDLVEVYTSEDQDDLYELAELLTDLDERIWTWHSRHYGTVVRAIGEKTTGTQGTPVEVLRKLIAQRQLARFWEVRAELVELFDQGARNHSDVVDRADREADRG